MSAEIFRSGYVVFRNAIRDQETMAKACATLVEWHSVERDLHEYRYGHAPEFCDAGGVDSLRAELQRVVETLLGPGNAAPRKYQLLGSIDAKAPEPLHTHGHIDNVPNAVVVADQSADEQGVPRGQVAVRFPNFNVIAGIWLTSGRVRVWPGSHLAVAAYFKQSDDIRKLLLKVNADVVNCYDGPSEVLELGPGDVVVMNHLLIHAAADPIPDMQSPWIVPNRGPLSARLYVRWETIDPPPEGLNAMRNPWHGCRGVDQSSV